MRLAAARGTLGAHHSAQIQRGPSGGSYGDHRVRLAGAAMPDVGRDTVPGMGKYPTWICGPCGTTGNWQCRRLCRGCGRDPPKSIRDRQREHLRDRSSTQGRSGNSGGGQNPNQQHQQHRQWNRNQGGGGGGAARGDGSNASRTDVGPKTFADAVRVRDWAGEVAELKKSNERLLRQLSAMQSNRTKSEDDDDKMDDDEGDETAAAARDERIKVLEAGMPSLIAVFTEDSSQVKGAKEELAELVRQRRESKPLRTQLQNVDRRIDKQRQKSERLQAKADELRCKIDELQEECALVTSELGDTKEGLAALEDERKTLLLKEAQQEDAAHRAQPGAPTLDGGPQLDAAWTTVVQNIGARLNLPGTNQQLGSQVSATVQLLRDLLVQLAAGNGGPAMAAPPAMPPGAAAATPAAAGSGAAASQPSGRLPATAQGDGSQSSTRRAASGVNKQDGERESVGSGGRERSPRPRADTSRFRQHRGQLPTSPNLSSADDAIAAAGIVGTATDAMAGTTAASNGPAPAEDDGASSRTDPASAAAAATAQGAAGDVEIPTGTATDSDEFISDSDDDDAASAVAMDLEMAIAELPQGQRRAKMREILANSNKKKGPKAPRGLRKPAESGRAAAADSKKPAKESKD